MKKKICKPRELSTTLLDLVPTQGARGTRPSQSRFQCRPLQQASHSSSPGAELFLVVPAGAVGSSQKPSSSNPYATGFKPEPVQYRRIPGWGRPWDASVSCRNYWIFPASFHPIIVIDNLVFNATASIWFSTDTEKWNNSWEIQPGDRWAAGFCEKVTI